jgi:hypothetical protein
VDHDNSAAVPAVTVKRPIWRRYLPTYRPDAIAFVRRGGHAAIVHPRGRIEALVGLDATGKLTELGEWSLLAIEQTRWRRVRSSPGVDIASARVKPDYVDAVLDWCERDAVHPGPTRRITLDCQTCAACCHDMNVVLAAEDVERWSAAGRSDLHGRVYLRRRDGRLVLRVHDTGRCLHLRRDKLCRIYDLRPDNCRAFVVGSEACLAAREETLALRDG